MSANEAIIARRSGVLGARKIVLGAILVAAGLSALHLRLSPASLVPGRAGMEIATEFFSRAVRPALTYEAPAPPGTTPLLWKAAGAARVTVVFAATSMSLALAGGIVLAFFSSTAWWSGQPIGGETVAGRAMRRTILPAVWGASRFTIAFMRSIHELLWAVLFLAAFGLGELPAILAIAIPYAGTLAKVFSEMIDEAPREAAAALRDAGATGVQTFLFGLLPRAIPDMSAYTFYRFECALRSSAILGFFGFPTLGYFIAASFENLHYGEVWTYIYTLFLLIALADWWSGKLRRDFVS